VLAATPAYADQPLWELGAGLGGLRLPHYRGSEQSHEWLFPVPYLVYRGAIFVADEDGTRAVLLDTERVDFDISLGGSPPAESRDNRARAGMPDLRATVEIGPRVNLRLARGAGWKLELRVPVRIGFTLRQPVRDLGFTATPVLNLDADVAGWDLGLQAGPIAGSQRFHAYFYDVDPAYATVTRPAYRAGSGYAGWAATTSASRRLGPWWLAGYMRYDSVAGATFGGSALVTKRDNFAFGLTASWIFKISDERVAERS
jgi:outer membrane scaffolding protein for murein synthesis (MipA/OmpV family)